MSSTQDECPACWPAPHSPMVAAAVLGLALLTAHASDAGRKHPENDLLARPAIVITVGVSNASIIGNDNRALQAAVDYVGNLGGGVVEIGPGEYLMRDSLRLRSRLELLRDGVEDCDHLTLFEKARCKEAMRALIARATTDLSTYTTEPALLDALRRGMAGVLDPDRHYSQPLLRQRQGGASGRPCPGHPATGLHFDAFSHRTGPHAAAHLNWTASADA